MSRPVASPESRPLGQTSADRVRLKSTVEGPLAKLDPAQRGLLLAEVCLIGYLSFDERLKVATRMGWTPGPRVHADDIRAFLFQANDDLVVMFRGPEFLSLPQIAPRLDSTSELSDTVGRVHAGLNHAAIALWPQLENVLSDQVFETLWFAGHSLGGAVATLCSQRCLVSPLPIQPAELHTFGSPRVGTRAWASALTIPCFRWVNHLDPVCQLPSALAGFVHAGEEQYLTEYGQLRNPHGFQRTAEQLRALGNSLRGGSETQFREHLIAGYVEKLFEVVRGRGLFPAGHRAPDLTGSSE